MKQSTLSTRDSMLALVLALSLTATAGASAQEPASDSSPLTRGTTALEEGRSDQALGDFQAVLEDSPDNREALIGLATALARLGRNEEAKARYQRAAELDPDDAAPRIGVADVFLGEGSLDQALANFQAARQLDPMSERARLGEAQALHALGEHRQLLERLEEAHEALPTSGLVAYGLAWVLAASPDASVRDGQRALDLAEGVYKSHQSLQNAELVAEALGELGRCEKAAQWLRGMRDSALEDGAPDATVERLRSGVQRFEQGPPCRAEAEASVAADG